MTYFVTGATGFIGRHLLAKLLARKGEVYCLVRKGSQEKFEELRARFGGDGKRLHAVSGDLAKPALGLSAAQRRSLDGRIKHFFHLAAIYDLAADAESQQSANVEGTRHAVELATQLKAGCFHHMSSIAVAGLYPGVFREDMFAEAEDLENPYFKTKHEAEAL
ncbi:MAG TPA: SDR family oxidoreductase, partial [Rudaea sp.]|nr:SDR family oxidoreductase [Rudaea sp.]